ncbi:MAG: NAD(P)(+) transhydrogenase (Re/Si-specific) subunit beta [Frankiales bacterium]|nr:MAG: NAD(P)(+) transhydrogenase (Re/Si-specific) subunit beta [Frankiales bacterium]
MTTASHLLYLVAAVTFVIGLHLMGSPATARRGNLLSAGGMALAILVAAAVLVDDGTIGSTALLVLVAGLTVGSVAGLVGAKRVQMTDMPQLVSLFNAVGGGAAALVAFVEVLRADDVLATVGVSHVLPTYLDVLIGALTFSGSLVAAGKLAGKISGNPVTSQAGRVLTVLLAGFSLVAGIVLLTGTGGTPLLLGVAVAALGLGVLLTLPIGGADMPVVISLLNACTGTAVAMAGFVLDSVVLVIAGALVGAAGTILTILMAEAMNRSLLSILLGGYGTGDVDTYVAAAGNVRETSVDDAGLQLAYASKVVVVPGYGLAAAQAQHELVALCKALEASGVEVTFGIHPVAGRMPGHMNVLLAEADVPYTQLQDLEEVNPEFARTDVVLVVGANDVTNPAARRPGNPVSGMPILDVDKARSVIVVKRSMGTGYAGIDNELYTDPKTSMLFRDAKAGLKELVAAVHTYVR